MTQLHISVQDVLRTLRGVTVVTLNIRPFALISYRAHGELKTYLQDTSNLHRYTVDEEFRYAVFEPLPRLFIHPDVERNELLLTLCD